jgi:hypothetical protein
MSTAKVVQLGILGKILNLIRMATLKISVKRYHHSQRANVVRQGNPGNRDIRAAMP